MNNDVKERVLKILSGHINKDIIINPTEKIEDLIHSYEIDSLDKVMIILSLENEFHINIPDKNMEKWTRVSDIIDFIDSSIICHDDSGCMPCETKSSKIVNKAIITTSANPFHYGHLDIYNKTKQIFYDVKVVIAQNSDKNKTTNIEGHMKFYDIPYEIVKNQTIADYCKENDVTHIIRGIRNGVDAEYELKIDFVNKEINPHVQTIFIPTSDTYSNVSSSTIRELLRYKKYDIVKKYMNENAMWKWIEDNVKN